MGCVRIARTNYLDTALLASYDVTSEQSAFPLENAFSRNRRSKVWRSNGYFQVKTGENDIVFRESVGVDLTATVAVGEYNTTASFMTAVKNALDAAGASTYTVTQTSSLRFQIASDLAGGGGLFELRFASSTEMADLLGFDDVNRSTMSPQISDYLRINYPRERIIFDFGIDTLPESFYLIGPRNQALKISPSAIIKLEASPTDIWDSPPFSASVAYNDEVLHLYDIDLTATQAYRFWSISIEDQNQNGYVEVGAFFLGTEFITTRGGVNYPLNSTLNDRTTSVRSEGGQSFSSIREKTQTFSLEWNALTKVDVEVFEQMWADYGLAYPFFIAIDREEAFSTETERRIKFVKFTGEPSWSLIGPNIFKLSMTVQEEL